MLYGHLLDAHLNDMIETIYYPDQIKKCLPKLNQAFNRVAWTAYSRLCAQTNCMTYALGQPDMECATPGRLVYYEDPAFEGGEGHYFVNIQRIQDGLERDGLIEVSETSALSGDLHVIALTVAMSDFHFHRRDEDGTWSDKPGWEHCPGAPINPRRNPHITVPSQHATDSRYKKFGGYWAVPNEGIEYSPRLHIPGPVLQLF